MLMRAGSAEAVWVVFLALTALHIFANVRAVRALEVRTLNAARLEGLLAHYAATVSASDAPQRWHALDQNSLGTVGHRSPAEALQVCDV